MTNQQLPNSQEEMDSAGSSLLEALNLSFRILKGIMVLLLILFLSSGIFTVDQNEEAMILRFGKVQGTKADRILKPGLHWTWPYPLSDIIRIPTGKEHTLTIKSFWYHESMDTKSSKIPESLDPEVDGYCITGDANIIHYQWQVRYLITDPYLYHTRFKDPENMLESIVASSIVKTTATFEVHDALRNKIDDLRSKVKEDSQEVLDKLECGISLQGVVVPQVVAPRQVQDAFQEVIRAKTEFDKKIDEARNYQKQILNIAEGEQAEILAKAHNDALQIQKELESQSGYFQNLIQHYDQNTAIFIEQHYQNIIEELTAKIKELFIFTNKVPKRELQLQFNSNPDIYRIGAPKED
ncbi:MAG: protease modulator HflK [Planctomycetes bacterium]|jgi:membrane protease subunit HflK|nr:protease modulator HflK [Planctomycetota bacterium]